VGKPLYGASTERVELTSTDSSLQVVKERFADGDTATVHFSSGPECFTAWPGYTPPAALVRSEDGLPSATHAAAWASSVDVARCCSSEAACSDATDVQAVRSLLRKYAGGLTAVFLYASGNADVAQGWDNGAALKQSSFRNALQDAKLVGDKLKLDDVDACYARGAAAAGLQPGSERLSLLGFACALICVASTRAARGDGGPAVAPSAVHGHTLAMALEKLLVNSLFSLLGVRISRAIDLMTFKPDGDGAAAAVQSARRPQLHTLMQHIPRWRPASEHPQVALSCLAAFLARSDAPAVAANSKLTLAALGALQRNAASVSAFAAMRLPLSMGIEALEALLLALAVMRSAETGGTPAEALAQLMVRRYECTLCCCCAAGLTGTIRITGCDVRERLRVCL